MNANGLAHRWTLLILSAALLAPLGWLSAAPSAEPAGKQDADSDLLKQLDEQVGDKVLDRAAGPRFPDSARPATPLKPKNDKDATEHSTGASTKVPAAGSPAPKKPSAKESTDEQLLKDLDASDAKGLPKGPAQPESDLGDDVDPVTKIGAKMRRAEELIHRDKLSDKTTQLQGEIVNDIDQLMKQVKKQMKQKQDQQQASAAARKRQQATAQRQAVRQATQPKPAGGAQKPSGGQPQNVAQGQESKKPASDSEKRLGPARVAKVDAATINDMIKKVWVNLPDKDREQMRQAAAEKFLPKYEVQIEKYFRRLAEESEPQP